MLPFVNNCLSHLFPQAALAETLGMTLRESHQICQLDLVTLTEPLQAYIPKEEDIQIPLKKLEAEANSGAPITPETQDTPVPPENPDGPSPDLTSEEPTTEKLQEDQNSPVETTGEAEPVSDPSEVTPTPAESAPESAQTASEPMEAATAEVSDTTTVEVKPENQPETEVEETKND